MIAILEGIVNEKFISSIVLMTGGVGYEIFMTNEDSGNLTAGDKSKIYVYEHIRENMHDLYGFTNLDSRYFFEDLININGVGPKMALNLLNIGSSTDVKNAIAEGNIRYLQAAQGVGKRVAERIVVDLKDKVGLNSTANINDLLRSDSSMAKDEAVAALVSLGYTAQDAVKALQDVDKKLPTEERIRAALKRV
jgi:Holliday junction DNA helicase RuvA